VPVRAIVTTAIEIAGFALVAVGVGMIVLPAGVIVGGAALVGVGFLEGRK
jgi:hypothetical protein